MINQSFNIYSEMGNNTQVLLLWLHDVYFNANCKVSKISSWYIGIFNIEFSNNLVAAISYNESTVRSKWTTHVYKEPPTHTQLHTLLLAYCFKLKRHLLPEGRMLCIISIMFFSTWLTHCRLWSWQYHMSNNRTSVNWIWLKVNIKILKTGL